MGVSMASPLLATVLITGGLATAGAIAAYDRDDRDAASARGIERSVRLFDDSYGSFEGALDVDEDRTDPDRDHEFNLDIWGPRGRERLGVRIDENRPSVFVNAGSAGQAAFSIRRAQRRDEEDSDGDSEGDSERRRGGWWGRERDRDRDDDRWGRERGRENGGARGRDTAVEAVAYDYGFNDGYDHGLQDGRDRNNYDPVRHRDYRSADRGYDGRLGSREQYRIVYRDGFRDGYDRGYRDGQDSSRNGGRIRLPWPF